MLNPDVFFFLLLPTLLSFNVFNQRPAEPLPVCLLSFRIPLFSEAFLPFLQVTVTPFSPVLLLAGLLFYILFPTSGLAGHIVNPMLSRFSCGDFAATPFVLLSPFSSREVLLPALPLLLRPRLLSVNLTLSTRCSRSDSLSCQSAALALLDS